MKTNRSAIAGLPQATKSWVSAFIVEWKLDPKEANNPLWKFQFNPEKLKYNLKAKWTSSDTMAVREPDMQFGGTDAETLDISEIYLDSYHAGKSLQPALDGLRELLKADLKKAKFAPKVLSFVWGQKTFGPCVLESIDWEEDRWLAGAPATLRLNMKFIKVPPPGQLGQQPIAPEPDAPKAKEAKGEPRKPLTDRQRQDASSAAKKWLEGNQSKLKGKAATLTKNKAYKLSTNKDTGEVTMADAKGVSIGIVGQWDGKTFNIDKAKLI